MSVVGEFTITAEAFALENALATVPEITIEADQIASHSPHEVFPFLWATGGDCGAFHDALAADPIVDTVSIADETGDEALFRLVWTDEFCELIHDMIDHHAAILEATATKDHWNLRLRFSEEHMVTSFQDHFRETGREFEVNSLRRPTGPRQPKYGLTPQQYEALRAAVESGYFSIPRTTSVEVLGDTLGISANAMSQRIRRGCDTLIQSSLLIDTDAADE